MTRQALVLAGGLATRMLPLTREVPKYLLPVAGRPFAAWQLERLAACAYDDVVVSIGHLGDAIRAFVGDGAAFGLRVRYVDEGDARLGTGGAIALAARQGLLDDDLLVTYGDSYLPFDYAAPLDALRADAALDGVMAVFENAGRWDASNVELSADRTRVARYEKGGADAALRFIDYGATALRRRVVEARTGAFGLDAVQTELACDGRMGAVVADERFYEIGSPDGLHALEAHLAAAAPRT